MWTSVTQELVPLQNLRLAQSLESHTGAVGPWNVCISASLSSRGQGVGDSPEGVWQGLHTAQALLGQIWVQVLMIACLCDLEQVT